jgi:hypothetical protein
MINRRLTEPKIIDHANILDQLLLHIGAQSKGSASRTNRSTHDQSLAQRALNYRSIDITMHTHTHSPKSGVVTNIHEQ